MPSTLCTCIRDERFDIELIDPECRYHRTHPPQEES